jgi:hypothetical protein
VFATERQGTGRASAPLIEAMLEQHLAADAVATA